MSRRLPVTIWMFLAAVLVCRRSTTLITDKLPTIHSNSSETLDDDDEPSWSGSRTLNASVLLFDETRDLASDCGRDGHDLLDRKSVYKAASDLAVRDARLPARMLQVNVDFVSLKDDCLETGGLLTLVDILNNDSVNAVIGSVASPVCRASIALANLKTKPFVSWGCVDCDHDHVHPQPSAAAISNRQTIFEDNRTMAHDHGQQQQQQRRRRRRRHFYRVSPSSESSARALVRIIAHFRWKQSAIVISSEDETWLALANHLDVALREERHFVRHFVVLPVAGDRNQIRDKLAGIILARIKAVILCVPLGSRDMEHLLQVAQDEGGGVERAFFAVHVRNSFASPLPSPSNATLSPFIFTYVPPNATYRETAVKSAKLADELNITKHEDYELFQRVYDSMALLLGIIVSTSRSDGPATIVARGFLGPIVSSATDGIVVHYALLHYEPTERRYAPVLYVRDDRVLLENNGDGVAGRLPPPDLSCQLNDKDECVPASLQDSKFASVLHLVAVVASSAFLCVSLICLGLLIRRIVRRRDMTKGPYGILIYPGDLVLVVPHSQINSNLKHLADFPGLEKPDLLKGSHDSLRGFTTNGSPKMGASPTVAAAATASTMVVQQTPSPPSLSTEPCNNVTRARYKGDLVLVKYLQSRPLELRNKTLKELRMVHDLRHENVNTFIGYFVNPERPALVFEYCTRGSLQDVLSSENIKLDWAFKLSLLTDLVRGVRYLHSSPIRFHGRLTSRNCVIDSRWVLKVTDCGVSNVYASQGLSAPKQSASGLLWTAPELLRSDSSFRSGGTQAGDVYSFSIIMQEVLVRGPPYCMLPLTAEEIIEKVMHPPPMIRPSVSKQAAPPEAINIMRECWAEIPDMRPDFTVIYEQFKRLNHGKKVNIVDTMFQMLEKYSNNLEEIIRERTDQLAEEKKKTEQLLHRMLPSSVAERLKMGLPVEPEAYEEVTIYFSDIVGFTTISAYSTPMEVIDLLNDLYTCFDATINAYNVYKVETIGDAYMVVGGLPVRMGDHACQVAQMALELLHQSGKFKIQHLPLTRLKLRIGIHTGPCCAGVVGLTMPRYCLFGDTVNTASRMESTGHACRIHISEATKEKLDQAGGYHISCRGEIELKGKGRATSYWLLGKDGFDKPLPAPMENEEASHCFDEELLRQCQALPRFSEFRLSSNVQLGAYDVDPVMAEVGGAWCANFHRPSVDSNTNSNSGGGGGGSANRDDSGGGGGGHDMGGADPTHVLELGRRTLSNASEILTGVGCPTCVTGSSPDTQSVHSQPHPASHSHAQLHGKKPLKMKALEYIANANSYILNMNRAHSLDSSAADKISSTATSAVATVTLPYQPPPPPSLCPRLCSHLLQATHSRSGERLDNESFGHHLHCNNRRSSEILESNVRNHSTYAIRRYSNPRYYAAMQHGRSTAEEERNGNFLTVASATISAASATADRRSSLDIRLTPSTFIDLIASDQENDQTYQHDVNIVGERDKHAIDSSL